MRKYPVYIIIALLLFLLPIQVSAKVAWVDKYAEILGYMDPQAHELSDRGVVSRSSFIKLIKNVISPSPTGWYQKWLRDPDNFPGNQNPITRAQALDILVETTQSSKSIAENYSDIDGSSWYAASLTTARHKGWISGFSDGSFRPNALISGPEVLKIVSLAIESPSTEFSIDTQVSDDVYVTSEPLSYKGGKIPAGASAVEFLRFTIHNPTPRSLLLQSLTVKRMGLGDSADIDSVSIWEGLIRLSSPKSINRDSQTVIFSFPSQKIYINKLSSRTFSVRASISRTASPISEHYFVIYPKDIVLSTETSAGPTVSGEKLLGNPFSVASIPRGELTINAGHTPQSVSIGQRGAIFGELILEANGREDLLIQSMTLENKGTLGDTDLANIKLVHSTSRKLLAGPILQPTNGYVGFDFTHHPQGGLYLDRNDRLRVFIMGDIVDGFSGATVRFELDEPSDVQVIGLTSGGYQTFQDRQSGSFRETTIARDTATFSRTRFLDKVGSNTSKVIIGQLETVVRGRGALIRTAVFDIFVNGSMADTTLRTKSGIDKGMAFRNVSIIDPKGQRVAGPTDPILMGNGYKLVFSDDFIIPSAAEEQGYFLLSDIRGADNGDRYRIQFNIPASDIDFDYY